MQTLASYTRQDGVAPATSLFDVLLMQKLMAAGQCYSNDKSLERPCLYCLQLRQLASSLASEAFASSDIDAGVLLEKSVEIDGSRIKECQYTAQNRDRKKHICSFRINQLTSW
jgi:hypothetical protein